MEIFGQVRKPRGRSGTRRDWQLIL